MAQSIEYSEKYNDDDFEYRHVILPASASPPPPWASLRTLRAHKRTHPLTAAAHSQSLAVSVVGNWGHSA